MVQWDFSPDSGVGPYSLTAVFTNASLLDDVTYSLETYIANTTGYCYADYIDLTKYPLLKESVLTSGSWSPAFNVDAGDCLVAFAVIVEVATGNVLQIVSAKVDNL